MGKLSFGMMASLDGYVAGVDGGLSLPAPGEALHRHFNERMKRATVVLYGRRMYEVMQFWETRDADPAATEVEIEFARAWKKTPKVVFSTTLARVGPNARLVITDVAATVRAIKEEEDGEIEVAGPEIAANLARLGLVDEYRLYLMPFVLGGGKPFFAEGSPSALRLLGSESLPEGVTLLRYGVGANGT